MQYCAVLCSLDTTAAVGRWSVQEDTEAGLASADWARPLYCTVLYCTALVTISSIMYESLHLYCHCTDLIMTFLLIKSTH